MHALSCWAYHHLYLRKGDKSLWQIKLWFNNTVLISCWLNIRWFCSVKLKKIKNLKCQQTGFSCLTDQKSALMLSNNTFTLLTKYEFILFIGIWEKWNWNICWTNWQTRMKKTASSRGNCLKSSWGQTRLWILFISDLKLYKNRGGLDYQKHF